MATRIPGSAPLKKITAQDTKISKKIFLLEVKEMVLKLKHSLKALTVINIAKQIIVLAVMEKTC